MTRRPISIRPTAAQLAWLQDERRRRGLAINALVLMALEAAMNQQQHTTTDRPAA